MVADVNTRAARGDDLSTLAKVFGQEQFFVDRLERQRGGRGMLLIAELDDLAVGDVYLWLEPAEEPELNRYLPGVPLIQHFEVHEPFQSRGIGTRLLAAAERELRHRGHGRVALGVGLSNEGAMRLYQRLGYREWPYGVIATSWEEFLPNGARRRTSEWCHIYLKDLTD